MSVVSTETSVRSIPTHSRAYSVYTFPALISVDVWRALRTRASGPGIDVSQTLNCTHGGKRRRDRATGHLREGVACGSPAAWVGVWMPYTEQRTMPTLYKPGVFLCEKHGKEKARRDKIPMIDTIEQYEQYRLEVIAFRERDQREIAEQSARAAEQAQREHEARERETLERCGRVLRMSGYAGRLYMLSDGSLECEMNDGSKIKPCCWGDAARIIDNRIRRAGGHAHSADCARAQDE